MSDSDSNFFSRWSRRKTEVRDEKAAPAHALAGQAPAAPPRELDEQRQGPETPFSPAPASPPASPHVSPAAPPAPTLADVDALTTQSDYAPFVARDVAPEVKQAALKKLFTDPHFNVMDGLDVYIDDYGKPDPLPPGMLRQMMQSQLLGLFDHEKKNEVPGDAAVTAAPPDSSVGNEVSEPLPHHDEPSEAPGTLNNAAMSPAAPTTPPTADP